MGESLSRALQFTGHENAAPDHHAHPGEGTAAKRPEPTSAGTGASSPFRPSERPGSSHPPGSAQSLAEAHRRLMERTPLYDLGLGFLALLRTAGGCTASHRRRRGDRAPRRPAVARRRARPPAHATRAHRGRPASPRRRGCDLHVVPFAPPRRPPPPRSCSPSGARGRRPDRRRAGRPRHPCRRASPGGSRARRRAVWDHPADGHAKRRGTPARCHAPRTPVSGAPTHAAQWPSSGRTPPPQRRPRPHRHRRRPRHHLAVPAQGRPRHRHPGAEQRPPDRPGPRDGPHRRRHRRARRLPDAPVEPGRPARDARPAPRRLPAPSAPLARILHPHTDGRGAVAHRQRHRRRPERRHLHRHVVSPTSPPSLRALSRCSSSTGASPSSPSASCLLHRPHPAGRRGAAAHHHHPPGDDRGHVEHR